jgi:hypothetical protein
MCVVTSMDPAALPNFTESDGCVHGASKYAQVGPAAGRKLLDSIIATCSAPLNMIVTML